MERTDQGYKIKYTLEHSRLSYAKLLLLVFPKSVVQVYGSTFVVWNRYCWQYHFLVTSWWLSFVDNGDWPSTNQPLGDFLRGRLSRLPHCGIWNLESVTCGSKSETTGVEHNQLNYITIYEVNLQTNKYQKYLFYWCEVTLRPRADDFL